MVLHSPGPMFYYDSGGIPMSRIFNSRLYRQRRKELRNRPSKAEIVLWGYLRKSQLLDMKFRRQQGVGRFVVDFYCPDLKLAIEVDGDTHYKKSEIIRDRQRQRWIESLGIHVIRFTNDQVIQDTYTVLCALRVFIRNHP